MDHADQPPGWQISQVVELIDMPRRDITRSCYADRKRGGAGILQPLDGSWGRRNYSVEDIAWLYLVKLQHEAGYSLPEIAQRMDTSVGVDQLCAHLDTVVSRAAEGLDELRLKVERARALRCALGAGSAGAHEAIESYLQDRLGATAVEELRRMLEYLASAEPGAGASPPASARNAPAREKAASIKVHPIEQVSAAFSTSREWTWQSSCGRAPAHLTNWLRNSSSRGTRRLPYG